ncbi:AAA family ATPase [Streptomyces sp. NPDC059080]|uniref:AAA family ATPase n=1 Tax=Streptomyces sp. NPDC059080 TaxID=3346718 RepID=UPI00369A1FEE
MDTTVKIRQHRRMLRRERPVVVTVCGSPGAGKTTVARATARRLGVPFLTRDEIKVGLGLSLASATEDGSVQLTPEFHIAGGPLSLRAESVMVNTAQLLASSGVSFVVESSVLSRTLIDDLLACDARILAVHVVARTSVIDERLRARAANGGATDRQLLSQFQQGDWKRSIFDPPSGVDAIVEVDTTDEGAPDTDPIEAAVTALIR